MTSHLPPFLVSGSCSSFLCKSRTRTENTCAPGCGLGGPCKGPTSNSGWGFPRLLPPADTWQTHLGQATGATATAATHTDSVHAGHRRETGTLPPAPKPQPPVWPGEKHPPKPRGRGVLQMPSQRSLKPSRSPKRDQSETRAQPRGGTAQSHTVVDGAQAQGRVSTYKAAGWSWQQCIALSPPMVTNVSGLAEPPATAGLWELSVLILHCPAHPSSSSEPRGKQARVWPSRGGLPPGPQAPALTAGEGPRVRGVLYCGRPVPPEA